MAANITRTYLLALFDEFKDVPSQKVDAYISIASLRVDKDKWGDVTPYATALLSAHMLAVGGGAGGSGGGASGPVTSESVGDLSRSYGTVGQHGSGDQGSGSGDQELLTTRYGQEFVALRRETILPCFVTGALSG